MCDHCKIKPNNCKQNYFKTDRGNSLRAQRSSFYIYGTHRQRGKFLKMVVETVDKNQFSCPEFISKVDPAA